MQRDTICVYEFTICDLDTFHKILIISADKRGAIYKAQQIYDIGTNNYVTIKCVEYYETLSHNQPDDIIPLRSTFREIKILEQVSHANIVRLIEVIKRPLYGFIVLEYHGDLFDYMRRFPYDGRMLPSLVKSFLYQVYPYTKIFHSI